LTSLLDRYGYMLWMREFELACLEGVPTREIHGELHTGIGQEAIAAGLVGSLRADDALCSTHRNHLHAIAKGVDMRAMLAEIFERETGLCGGYGGHMHLMDPKLKFSATGIVGAGVPVALGHAYAARLKNSDAVAVAIIGDGAVNTGAFHEAMNLAGVLQLPMIVVVENNEWAISVPFEASSPTATVAERAPAWAASGVKVDGNDVEKVAEAFEQAVNKARSGGGPSLIEASCYRFRGHFEGDADTYRSQQEKQERRQIDPLTITRALVLERNLATASQLEAMEASVRSAVLEMLAQVRAEPHPNSEHALRHVFVEAGN
jgi:acetoin:2,6-dichlorophenolindophenol oxidoreductase subunit alpha